MHPKTYRRYLKKTLRRIDDDVHTKLMESKRPIVIWVDNYQVYQAKTALHVMKNLKNDGSRGLDH